MRDGRSSSSSSGCRSHQPEAPVPAIHGYTDEALAGALTCIGMTGVPCLPRTIAGRYSHAASTSDCRLALTIPE